MSTYAEVVEELQRLTRLHGGLLPPRAVVDAAREDESPLHDQFEWDDAKASESWRLEQARRLIRRVTVTYTPPGQQDAVRHRVSVSLSTDRAAGGGYRRMVDVLADEDLRHQLLQDALFDLQRFREKYGQLTELARLFEAVEDVEREVGKPLPLDANP